MKQFKTGKCHEKKISLLAVLGLALLAPSSYSYAQDESSLTNCNCPAGTQGVPGLRGKKGSPGVSATKSVASLFSLVNQQLSAGALCFLSIQVQLRLLIMMLV